jgi:hypothetical protein
MKNEQLLTAINMLIAELEEKFQKEFDHPTDAHAIDIMRKTLKYLHKKQIDLQALNKMK